MLQAIGIVSIIGTIIKILPALPGTVYSSLAGRTAVMSFADTIYTFTFVSTLGGTAAGDFYLGWVVADTGTYAVGQSFWGHLIIPEKYDGAYFITGETNYNADLGDYYELGYEDGMTYVTSYFDASVQSYVAVSYTQPEPGMPLNGVPYGTNYIGSEYGWSGKMTNFGLGSSTYALDAVLAL